MPAVGKREWASGPSPVLVRYNSTRCRGVVNLIFCPLIAHLGEADPYCAVLASIHRTWVTYVTLHSVFCEFIVVLINKEDRGEVFLPHHLISQTRCKKPVCYLPINLAFIGTLVNRRNTMKTGWDQWYFKWKVLASLMFSSRTATAFCKCTDNCSGHTGHFIFLPQ